MQKFQTRIKWQPRVKIFLQNIAEFFWKPFNVCFIFWKTFETNCDNFLKVWHADCRGGTYLPKWLKCFFKNCFLVQSSPFHIKVVHSQKKSWRKGLDWPDLRSADRNKSRPFLQDFFWECTTLVTKMLLRKLFLGPIKSFEKTKINEKEAGDG